MRLADRSRSLSEHFLRLIRHFESARADVIHVLDAGHVRNDGDIGLRIQRVARVFVKVGRTQQSVAELAFRGELASPGFFRLQIRDRCSRSRRPRSSPGTAPTPSAAHRAADRSLEHPVGGHLPGERRFGRRIGLVSLGECQCARRVGDRAILGLPAFHAHAEGGAPVAGELPAVLRINAQQLGLDRETPRSDSRRRRLSSRAYPTPGSAGGSRRVARRDRSRVRHRCPGATCHAVRARASRCRPDR